MTGSVVVINAARGMVGVLTEQGDYSVFDLLFDDPLEAGDSVSWSGDTPLGHENLVNLSKQARFEVYMQNHQVPASQLRQQLHCSA